jgi:hypothetical protein
LPVFLHETTIPELAGQIFMKFDVGEFYEELSGHLNFNVDQF